MSETPGQPHYRFVRYRCDMLRVECWCGKTRLLDSSNINVFVKKCNDFLYEHTYCEQVVKAPVHAKAQ